MGFHSASNRYENGVAYVGSRRFPARCTYASTLWLGTTSPVPGVVTGLPL